MTYMLPASLGVGGVFSGCATGIPSHVDMSDRLTEDKDYYEAYQNATRGGDLMRGFGLEHRISVTYLYPQFRSHLAKRLKDVYMQDAGAFSEADSKSGFFVSVFGSERDTSDLANTNHWTILLDSKGGPMRPVLVRKITDKLRWRNFFEHVTPWSVDYLVVFDTPSANPGAENLVEKPHAKLTIANGEGKMTLDW